MFSEISSHIFDDPEFKEDSVRELVIAPIISKLGYGPSGSTRATRSKTLQHPFIRVGTRNHPVTTTPDYTLYVNDKPRFALDAKSPIENVLKQEHIQQAYSYAIHPEIRCNEFGLCNGRELAIFDTNQPEPLLHLKFEDFELQWDSIEKYLSPKYLSEPFLRKFNPDFGMALKRLGIGQDTDLVLFKTRLNLFARISDELITASANCDIGAGQHCVSFDFHPDMLPSIVSGLPKPLPSRFCEALKQAPYLAAAGLVIELDLTARLGDETAGQSETFIPLLIQEVHASRFNPAEVANDPKDIPPHVFKLRDAFKIRTGEENT